MKAPRDIQSIGDEIAIIWEDGSESFFKHSYLREESPSAANKGEVDVLGQRHGGVAKGTKFPDVSITGWNFVGNYAVCFHFSDGHRSGIFSWNYLMQLAQQNEA